MKIVFGVMQHHATAKDEQIRILLPKKGWSIALYTIWSFCLWGRRLPPEEREKIRFQHRLWKRIESRMMNVLRAGFGEGTPQQVSDRRHKKRGSGFLWHRSILALSTFARFIRINSYPVFHLRAWSVSATATYRAEMTICFFSIMAIKNRFPACMQNSRLLFRSFSVIICSDLTDAVC